MMNNPLVSVVIPFYDNKKWLKEALESVQNQTYDNKEIIVINDGSKENIEELKCVFRNVKFVMKKNGGPATARNLGIEISKGKYIAFLDSDDYWHKEKLVKQITFMEKSQYVWSHHSYIMFWEDSNKRKKIDVSNLTDNVLLNLLVSFKGQTSCFVILREALIKNKITFPIDKRYGQDIYFFKLLAELFPLGYIDGYYSYFRIRGSNAGFNPLIQLRHKATFTNELIKENTTWNDLPTKVKDAYMSSKLNFQKFENISSKIKNDKAKKIVAYFYYLIPYFKLRACRKYLR